MTNGSKIIGLTEALSLMKEGKILFCIDKKEFMKFDENTDGYYIVYADSLDKLFENKWESKTVDINLMLSFTFKILKKTKSNIIINIQEAPDYYGLEVLDYLNESQDNIVYNEEIEYFYKFVDNVLLYNDKNSIKSKNSWQHSNLTLNKFIESTFCRVKLNETVNSVEFETY